MYERELFSVLYGREPDAGELEVVDMIADVYQLLRELLSAKNQARNTIFIPAAEWKAAWDRLKKGENDE